jgi:signal transduction histidine kinase
MDLSAWAARPRRPDPMLRLKLRQTAVLQAGVTTACMGLDWLFNGVLFRSDAYTPVQTFAISLVVGVPFMYYNVSLRIDAQQARRALVVSQAARADALARLETALQDAEAASRAKSAFLATMSHEIRTPLNGVLGMADAMFAGPLAPEQRERLEVVRQCGQAVLAQLNDVLDLSKIEAGRLELEEIVFDLAPVVSGATGPFAALAKAKGLSFMADIEAARGIYLGDPTRLRQVLYNLISNAVKFTERGAVGVEARRVAGGVRFIVRDSGVGMSAEAVAGLFTAFSQADVSTARRFGGTGLGLAICRELVTMMGGAISVESAPGEGAAFTVELPLQDASDAPAASLASAAPSELPPLRVLAADDNEINRLVIRTLLEQAGAVVETAEDGRGVIDAWRAGRFDVILMDARMPGMDGLDAARAIRKAEAVEGLARTPIIALTADVLSHQLAEFSAAGMDAHVAKPIDAGRLFQAIEALVDQADAVAAVV